MIGDRTQAPSGAGFALENRIATSRIYSEHFARNNVHRLAGFFREFRAGLVQAASRSEPRICLLTPGPYSQTYYEQAYLARYLGFLLVEGGDLVVRLAGGETVTLVGVQGGSLLPLRARIIGEISVTARVPVRFTNR